MEGRHVCRRFPFGTERAVHEVHQWPPRGMADALVKALDGVFVSFLAIALSFCAYSVCALLIRGRAPAYCFHECRPRAAARKDAGRRQPLEFGCLPSPGLGRKMESSWVSYTRSPREAASCLAGHLNLDLFDPCQAH